MSWLRSLWQRVRALGRPRRAAVRPLRPSAVPPVPRDIFLVAPGSLAALLRPALEAQERAEAAARAAEAGEGSAEFRADPAADPAHDGCDEALPYGDFRDPAEFDHFAALPPIERDALASVDWDALARDLTG
ncbi:MAG: hypothetical protein JNL90_07640 [Planctomycetes bacterium]|nr:hypothetical protein [Planctomycetota bacterium]